MKKLLFFELNEFNTKLLKTASDEAELPNIRRMLQLRETQLSTKDTYESDYLEPWVQWVSVHTGTSSDKHRIKHLGDVPGLETPQIWESLAKKGVTSGIWGAMNASRNNVKECLFFVPDPWTFSEPAYPSELNSLLELPRYVSKNYLKLSKPMVVKKFLGLLRVFFSSTSVAADFLKELPGFLVNLARFKGEHFVFIAFTEFMSSLLFLEYRKRYNPDFSVLFVNTMAHIQHHHWHGFTYRNNPRVLLGLRYVDRLLGRIFKETEKDSSLIVTNGLSQMNTNHEKPWILYRQKSPSGFLKDVGVKVKKVEPHMTHDAHLFFANAADCERAAEVLRAATVSAAVLESPELLFLVESYSDDPLKLFYRIQFTDRIGSDATFQIAGKAHRFFDFFDAIVERTGKHIPRASAFSNWDGMPEALENHELAHQVLRYFDAAAS